ncbi:MAG: hypothetical protein B6D39_11890, partial [Anaerolineae bacterium UTCFX2]
MKPKSCTYLLTCVCVLVLAVVLTACGGQSAGGAEKTASSPGGSLKLTLGAYTTPREAYRELIPLFQK